jgi:hypothetical protein
VGRVTLTIHIDYPEGAEVVSGPSSPAPPPAPVAFITSATPMSVQPVGEPWPPGECPKHHKPWKDGNYGPFCTARDESQQKGYCILRPGALYEGRPAA